MGAPLFGRGHDSDFARWITKPEESNENVFLNVFWAPKAIDPSYDVIVVGPWGCGAFGNDPELVAQSFMKVITNHDLLHVYKEIHFCLGKSMLGRDPTVGGKSNINVQVFRKVLGGVVQDYTADLQTK